MATANVTYNNTEENQQTQSVKSIKYTYGDLPEFCQSWYPAISSDTELPEQLHRLVPPKTVGDWLQITGDSYNWCSPKEALEYFITDAEAQTPSIIRRSYKVFGDDTALYSCIFCKKVDGFTNNVPGYSDDERKEITNDSPFTTDLRFAILASSSRKINGGTKYF
jgi:hypothetical protein